MSDEQQANDNRIEERQNDSPLYILLWSLLFTPIFGAYLLCGNWKKADDTARETRSKHWLMGLFAAYVIICILFFSWFKLFLLWLVWAVVEWRAYYIFSKNASTPQQYHSVKFIEAFKLFFYSIGAGIMNWAAFFDKQKEQWEERRFNGQGNKKQIL